MRISEGEHSLRSCKLMYLNDEDMYGEKNELWRYSQGEDASYDDDENTTPGGA